MKRTLRLRILFSFILALFTFSFLQPPVTAQQKIGKNERERGVAILRKIKDEIQKNYYDGKFHGVDIEAKFAEAEKMIQTAESNGQIYGIIGATLLEFNDSHLFFIPPQFASRIDYGWELKMVGDVCRITAIRPKSDAEKKLKLGDAVLSLNGVVINRDTMWKMDYLLKGLRPQAAVRFEVQTDGQEPRTVDVEAKVIQGQKVTDLDRDFLFYGGFRDENDPNSAHRFAELDKDTIIWRMPGFDLEPTKVDDIMNKAKKFKNIIFDLRGNGGGYVVMLERLVGHFFDKEIKIADRTGRSVKESKPSIAKPAGKNPFQGKVIILVDSDSGSAAEVFPKVMQLEKRATVLGDRSSGKVMQSIQRSEQYGMDRFVIYGLSVTNADLVMTDGKSLENIGVQPDELILPTGEDLLNQRDPVLARALELVGIQISPEKAGAIFPRKWN